MFCLAGRDEECKAVGRVMFDCALYSGPYVERVKWMLECPEGGRAGVICSTRDSYSVGMRSCPEFQPQSLRDVNRQGWFAQAPALFSIRLADP
jgi:hypothetical protein